MVVLKSLSVMDWMLIESSEFWNFLDIFYAEILQIWTEVTLKSAFLLGTTSSITFFPRALLQIRFWFS